jgi:phosphohistidine phosphatase
MKRLHVLRHAKSSWDDPALADRDRPLAPRGRKAAKEMARWAEAHELRVDLVVCSPALRATQTLNRVLASIGSPEVHVDESVYHASTGQLLARVQALPAGAGDAMLVGHNPGLHELCLLLARPGGERGRVEENLPTGALATLELDVDAWEAAEPGCADLTRLVLPRELGSP